MVDEESFCKLSSDSFPHILDIRPINYQRLTIFMCMCMHVCGHGGGLPLEARRRYHIPLELELMGSCELPDMGSGHRVCLLWKSNKHSKSLRHLSSSQL